MTLGIYCIARYKRHEEGEECEFVEYGAPFVEFTDETARHVVRESVKDVKDKVDLTLFAIVKVGEFYPDSFSEPVVGSNDFPNVFKVICVCSSLFDEVNVNE